MPGPTHVPVPIARSLGAAVDRGCQIGQALPRGCTTTRERDSAAQEQCQEVEDQPGSGTSQDHEEPRPIQETQTKEQVIGLNL